MCDETDNFVSFPALENALDKIDPALLPKFLMAEAKLARSLLRHNLALLRAMESVRRILVRASENINANHRLELIDLAKAGLAEHVDIGAGVSENALPDLGLYPKE